MSKWNEWRLARQVTENVRCSKCDKLIHSRNNKSGMCVKCVNTSRKPEDASNWQGGRRVSRGYVFIYFSGYHPRKIMMGNAGYVREHHLEWEKAHGCYLPAGHIIHHLNGIKDDNRPENLVAVEPKNHAGWTYVQSLQQRIRDLEKIIAS